MKNSQKGFIAPLLLALIAILLVGGGAYVYMQIRIERQTMVIDYLEIKDSIATQSIQGNIATFEIIGNGEQSCIRREYKIDFGDGENEYLDIAKGTCTGKEAIFTHTYQTRGVFTVRLHDLTGVSYEEPAFDRVENPVATTTVQITSITTL